MKAQVDITQRKNKQSIKIDKKKPYASRTHVMK
jgi:hypothetical protein